MAEGRLNQREIDALREAETCGCCGQMSRALEMVPEFGLSAKRTVPFTDRNTLVDLVEAIIDRVLKEES